jgi:TPR repeat protein
MTAGRATVVRILISTKSMKPFVPLARFLVVATLFVLVNNAQHLIVQAAQQRSPTSPLTAVPEDATVTQLRERANAGDASAQFNLGLLYFKGEGVPKDDTQAAIWYRKAAEQGNANAQHNLGGLYLMGQGVPKDDTQTVRWYMKAAEQGFALEPFVQYYLGLLYFNGHGVPQDDTQAVQWHRKAAEQGFALALNSLARLYANGRGVPRDYVEAHKWETLAVERASGAAQKKRFGDARDEFAKKMTPDELAEAEKRARDWTEAFEKTTK